MPVVLAPLVVAENKKFFLPIANGLTVFSALLLSGFTYPHSKYVKKCSEPFFIYLMACSSGVLQLANVSLTNVLSLFIKLKYSFELRHSFIFSGPYSLSLNIISYP